MLQGLRSRTLDHQVTAGNRAPHMARVKRLQRKDYLQRREYWGMRHPEMNYSKKPLPPLRIKRQAEEMGEWEPWQRDCLAESVVRQRFCQRNDFRAEAVRKKYLDLSCLPPTLQSPAGAYHWLIWTENSWARESRWCSWQGSASQGKNKAE